MEICVCTRTYIYTHRQRHVFINIYICLYYECAHACISLLWKLRVPRNNNIPIQHPRCMSTKSWFQEKWVLREMTDFEPGTGIIQDEAGESCCARKKVFCLFVCLFFLMLPKSHNDEYVTWTWGQTKDFQWPKLEWFEQQNKNILWNTTHSKKVNDHESIHIDKWEKVQSPMQKNSK